MKMTVSCIVAPCSLSISALLAASIIRTQNMSVYKYSEYDTRFVI